MEGLTHLHEEILSRHLDECKPTIVHRNLKTKNILLKHDLTACISDFGVAVGLQDGKLCGAVHTRVDTSRYLAPEVLDGSIDYSRCTSVDMYACGLVLWELASRCTAQLGAVPEYRLPFEEEFGQHPSYEEIVECVVIKRLRPAFKDNWKKSHPGLRDLCQTIQKCWAHNAEKRISAASLYEQCNQLQVSRNEAQWSRWSLNEQIESDEEIGTVHNRKLTKQFLLIYLCLICITNYFLFI
ncbi:activin receptor type-2B-like [Acyrthosiphon pisum]|uniref:Serine/threonine-protein kinase receptor n=1 Tax=Acyrthosiphon pisum TaxID=7029 RepID=A0A8R2JWQ5_ACYPI|nr:activin receptor type-2B-like [Acyrthosiphon pisum]